MIIRLFVLVAAMCIAGAAQAQDVVWSSPAAVCTPDAATVAGAGLKTNVASVQHAAGKTGALTLNCQIARFDSMAIIWFLRLTYMDSTGTATTAHARARIYRMPIEGSTATLMATAISNASGFTTLNSITSPSFVHTFDFDANVYWVRIDLQRGGNQTVVIHAVNIEVATI
jgi:hypothetical protein